MQSAMMPAPLRKIWRAFSWDTAAVALNVLLLVALALGLCKLPFRDTLGFALAYLSLFGLPGYLLLRLCLPGLHFDPATLAVFAVVAGVGVLSALVLPTTVFYRLAFGPVLLLHAGWQIVALGVLLWHPQPPVWRVRWPGPITWVYAAAAVLTVGGVVLALAAFDAADAIDLGGGDLNTYSSLVTQIYYHPTEVPRSSVPIHVVPLRLRISTWVYHQALIAWVTGLEPYQVVETHATGTLLVLAFLAAFALAYQVTRRANVALLAVVFTLLVALIETAETGTLGDVTNNGARLLRRVAEDKMLATYVFVPAALALTLHLLDRPTPPGRPVPWWRRMAPWAVVVLMLAAVVGTHPVPVGLYLLILGSYVVVRWLAQPKLPPWRTVVWVGGALVAVALVPLWLVLSRLKDPSSIVDWGAVSLVEGDLLRVRPDGAYILHPSHISMPLVFVGVVLALGMVLRLRHDRTARYLFAATAGPLLLTYTPYVTSTLGNILSVYVVKRLVWLLPTGLSLAVGCWLLVDRLRPRVRWVRVRAAVALVPLVCAVALVLPTYRQVAAQTFDLSRRPAWPEYSTPEGEDLAAALAPLLDREHPVLAPAEVNTYFYATLADVSVYHFRKGYLELHQLYQNPWWGLDAVALLRDFRPTFFVVENGSHAQTFARLQPGAYIEVYRNARYTAYRAGVWRRTSAETAHSLVARQTGTLVKALVPGRAPGPADWPDIAQRYRVALTLTPSDFRARYGLASTLAQMGEHAEAESLYRDLLDRFPDDGNVRVRLAGLLWETGRKADAVDLLLAALDEGDPAVLRALLDVPYLAALDAAQLDRVLDVWMAAPAFVSGPHPARDLAMRVLDVRGDRARAQMILERIPPAYRTPEDLGTLGAIATVEGDYAAALAHYDADRGRSVDNRRAALLLRGHLAMAAGDLDAAAGHYRAAADLAPLAAAYVFLGQAEAARGDLALAEAAYLAVNRLPVPDRFWGRVALSRLYADQDWPNDDEDAVDALERANAVLAVSGIAPMDPSSDPALRPALLPPTALDTLPNRANVGVPGSNITLAAWQVLDRTAGPPDAPAVRVALYWMAHGPDPAAPWWTIKATDPAAPVVYGELSSAAFTPPLAAVRWTFTVPLDSAEMADPPAAPADLTALAAVPREVGDGAGFVTYWLGQVMLRAPPPPEEAPAVPAAYALGGQVELYGYTRPDGPVAPGGSVTVALFWRALAPPPTDLTAFVHVLNADGESVAQVDAPAGSYPANLWEADARVVGVHQLTLPETLAPGAYRLVAGVYVPGTATRLTRETAPDGLIDLGALTVAR
jgi:tetratricopeptide (TPR) repeat protein